MFVLQAAQVKGRGGIATALLHYDRMFKQAGVRTAAVYRGPSAAQLRADGVDIIAAPSRFGAQLSSVADNLHREVVQRGGEPDVVIVHSDLAFDLFKRLFPKAVMVTPCHSDKTKRKARADLVITLNDEQQAMVSAALPRTRVRLLGNPFAPPELARTGTEKPDGPYRINFLGRLDYLKDPLTAMRGFAAAKLPAEIGMRVIGEGNLEAEMRAIAEPVRQRVSFKGWVDEAFTKFDTRDLLLLPSRTESFSYVIREALHYCVPVIASNIHVHRQVLADGSFGLLHPVEDWRLLAGAIEAAISDMPHMREMAARGRDAVQASVGAAAFFKAFSTEIEAALSRHRR